VVDLRAADLRFSIEETKTLLAGRFGLALPPDKLQALVARVEGWAAGVQMAGLVFSSDTSPSGQLPRPFDESLRAALERPGFILDYLAEEALNRQPKGLQDFLLKTSILEQMHAGLVQAVAGAPQEQGLAGFKSALALLSHLERSNLFVAPIDGARAWFRYHSLFAELLRFRLQQIFPRLIPELHRRAAGWYEQNGWTDEAFRHYLSSMDVEQAARLARESWQQAANHGDLDRALGWLNALPEEAIRRDANLSAAMCWLCWLKGRMKDMTGWLESAWQAFEADNLEPRDPGLESSLLTLRSIDARLHGDLAQTQAAIQAALACAARLDGPSRAIALGVARYHDAEVLRLDGRLEAAIQAYASALPDLEAAGVTLAAVSARVWLIKLYRSQGRLEQAYEESRRGLRYQEHVENPAQPAFGVLLVAAAEIYLERNELTPAEDLLAQALALGQLSGILGIAREGNRALARLRLAEGDQAGALAAAQEAFLAAEKTGLPEYLAETAAGQASVWIRLGLFEQASAWALSTRVAEKTAAGGACLEVEALALARLALAQSIAPTLDRLLAQAESEDRGGAALEIRILRALTYRQMGSLVKAQADIERALAQAALQGWRRIFLDEGAEGRRLLLEARSRLKDPRLTDYADSLLAAFGLPAYDSAAADPILRPFERVSEREREVLRLVAEGLSNREIAARLFLVEGTVKAHVHTIYRKLSVQNRTQAAARARETGLI
jgi:LuxR family maltose regulon positive regulatory protein